MNRAERSGIGRGPIEKTVFFKTGGRCRGRSPAKMAEAPKRPVFRKNRARCKDRFSVRPGDLFGSGRRILQAAQMEQAV